MRQLSARLGFAPLVVLSLASAGCADGLIGDPPSLLPGGPTLPTNPNNPDPPVTPPPEEVVPDCALPGLKASTAPMRRMTADQYVRVIDDLFRGAAPPATTFPVTTGWDGYSTNPDANVVTGLGAENLMIAAEEVALSVASNLNVLLPCHTSGDEACARTFLRTYGKRAFRRPMTSEEESLLMNLWQTVRGNTPFDETIAVLVTAMLQMPQFLYFLEQGTTDDLGNGVIRLTDYEIAARLSFLFWNTIPDDVLTRAADDGDLTDLIALEGHARRLLSDPKSLDVISGFYEEWADVSVLRGQARDQTLYPEFNDELARAMNEELLRFVHLVMTDLGGSYRALLTSNQTMVNQPLADFYGIVPNPSSGPNDWQPATLNAQQRPGILTRPAVMATHAHAVQGSTIFRGKLVRTRLLCEHIPAPPADAMARAPDFPADATQRERSNILLNDEYCGSCHRLMNPIGVGFENFDAIGAWREIDTDGSAIDVSGSVVYGREFTDFNGAQELSTRLSTSEQSQDCMVRQWFQYAFGREDKPADQCSIQLINQQFASTGYDIRELLVAMTQTDAFRFRQTHETVGGNQ